MHRISRLHYMPGVEESEGGGYLRGRSGLEGYGHKRSPHGHLLERIPGRLTSGVGWGEKGRGGEGRQRHFRGRWRVGEGVRSHRLASLHLHLERD